MTKNHYLGEMMQIQLDFNRDEWLEFGREIPDEAYEIIEEFWEDSEEWAIIAVTDKKWQTWITLKHPDWIVDAA